MIKSLKYYLSLYWGFISTSTARSLSFRTHFILLWAMDLFFYFSTLKSVDFIYNYLSFIGPFDRQQFLFYIAFMLSVDQLHMTFISENFWHLSLDIRTGNFDYVLVRPSHSIFQVFLRYFRMPSFFNCFVTWALLVYYGMQIHIAWYMWPLLPFLLLGALLLLFILEVSLSSLMFWTVEGNGINFLRMELQRISRWPEFIFQRWIRFFFLSFCPVLLIGNAPVHWLLNIEHWPIFVLAFVGVGGVFFFVMLKMWNKGLRAYESASS